MGYLCSYWMPCLAYTTIPTPSFCGFLALPSPYTFLYILKIVLLYLKYLRHSGSLVSSMVITVVSLSWVPLWDSTSENILFGLLSQRSFWMMVTAMHCLLCVCESGPSCWLLITWKSVPPAENCIFTEQHWISSVQHLAITCKKM